MPVEMIVALESILDCKRFPLISLSLHAVAVAQPGSPRVYIVCGYDVVMTSLIMHATRSLLRLLCRKFEGDQKDGDTGRFAPLSTLISESVFSYSLTCRCIATLI